MARIAAAKKRWIINSFSGILETIVLQELLYSNETVVKSQYGTTKREKSCVRDFFVSNLIQKI
jgi:hypothetical protein